MVSVQDPVRLDNRSEPEPDVALLRRRSDYYLKGHPEPEDVILVIEVADTSLAFDRNMKAGIYARAGIEEYWIVNLPENRVVVHRQPEQGSYSSIQTWKKGDILSPLGFPDILIAIDDILS